MPLTLSCPACFARLRAPENAAGRALRCPKCKGPVAVPVGGVPITDLEFDSTRSTSAGYSEGEGNPFDDEQDGAPEEAPSELDPTATPKKSRRPAAKKQPKAGFNPFDEQSVTEEPAADPSKKRRYRKDGDFNPFGDANIEEVPDPVGEGFEFGLEAPPATPESEFDFGAHDPRGDT